MDEQLSDGRLLEEGMMFYLTKGAGTFSAGTEHKTVTVVQDENYPHLASRRWLFIDEDGVDQSDEWYFFNGEYLEEIK